MLVLVDAFTFFAGAMRDYSRFGGCKEAEVNVNTA